MNQITDPKTIRDRIRGSLIAGAAGDALGYAVEFTGERHIFQEYGPRGIQDLEIDPGTGTAILSDDTQMTLFTAAGILDREEGGGLRQSVSKAYQAWLLTQEGSFERYGAPHRYSYTTAVGRLMRLRALHTPRAPGNTCLSALRMRWADGDPKDLDFIAHPYNRSKGCGGVMRTAPAAWIPGLSVEELDMEAAQYAAISHGGTGGWLPSAVGAHIVHLMTFSDLPLAEIVLAARDMARRLFSSWPETEGFCGDLDETLRLAGVGGSDLDNIHALGEGWVGDEALCIALYCALRYEHDLSSCLIAAVNHRGDSDSTGAIAGNILGARVGYEAMEEKWKTKLELHDEILELADRIAADYAGNT